MSCTYKFAIAYKVKRRKSSYSPEYRYDYEKQAAADSVVNAEANKVKNAQLAAEKAENKQHQLEADQQKSKSIFSMAYWHWHYFLEGLFLTDSA